MEDAAGSSPRQVDLRFTAGPTTFTPETVRAHARVRQASVTRPTFGADLVSMGGRLASAQLAAKDRADDAVGRGDAVRVEGHVFTCSSEDVSEPRAVYYSQTMSEKGVPAHCAVVRSYNGSIRTGLTVKNLFAAVPKAFYVRVTVSTKGLALYADRISGAYTFVPGVEALLAHIFRVPYGDVDDIVIKGSFRLRSDKPVGTGPIRLFHWNEQLGDRDLPGFGHTRGLAQGGLSRYLFLYELLASADAGYRGALLSAPAEAIAFDGNLYPQDARATGVYHSARDVYHGVSLIGARNDHAGADMPKAVLMAHNIATKVFFAGEQVDRLSEYFHRYLVLGLPVDRIYALYRDVFGSDDVPDPNQPREARYVPPEDQGPAYVSAAYCMVFHNLAARCPASQLVKPLMGSVKDPVNAAVANDGECEDEERLARLGEDCLMYAPVKTVSAADARPDRAPLRSSCSTLSLSLSEDSCSTASLAAWRPSLSNSLQGDSSSATGPATFEGSLRNAIAATGQDGDDGARSGPVTNTDLARLAADRAFEEPPEPSSYLTGPSMGDYVSYPERSELQTAYQAGRAGFDGVMLTLGVSDFINLVREEPRPGQGPREVCDMVVYNVARLSLVFDVPGVASRDKSEEQSDRHACLPYQVLEIRTIHVLCGGSALLASEAELLARSSDWHGLSSQSAEEFSTNARIAFARVGLKVTRDDVIYAFRTSLARLIAIGVLVAPRIGKWGASTTTPPPDFLDIRIVHLQTWFETHRALANLALCSGSTAAEMARLRTTLRSAEAEHWASLFDGHAVASSGTALDEYLIASAMEAIFKRNSDAASREPLAYGRFEQASRARGWSLPDKHRAAAVWNAMVEAEENGHTSYLEELAPVDRAWIAEFMLAPDENGCTDRHRMQSVQPYPMQPDQELALRGIERGLPMVFLHGTGGGGKTYTSQFLARAMKPGRFLFTASMNSHINSFTDSLATERNHSDTTVFRGNAPAVNINQLLTSHARICSTWCTKDAATSINGEREYGFFQDVPVTLETGQCPFKECQTQVVVIDEAPTLSVSLAAALFTVLADPRCFPHLRCVILIGDLRQHASVSGGGFGASAALGLGTYVFEAGHRYQTVASKLSAYALRNGIKADFLVGAPWVTSVEEGADLPIRVVTCSASSKLPEPKAYVAALAAEVTKRADSRRLAEAAERLRLQLNATVTPAAAWETSGDGCYEGGDYADGGDYDAADYAAESEAAERPPWYEVVVDIARAGQFIEGETIVIVTSNKDANFIARALYPFLSEGRFLIPNTPHYVGRHFCVRERNFPSMGIFNRRGFVMVAPVETQVMHIPLENIFGISLIIKDNAATAAREQISAFLRPPILPGEQHSEAEPAVEVRSGRYRTEELLDALKNPETLERIARRISNSVLAVVATLARVHGLDDLELYRLASVYIQIAVDDRSLMQSVAHGDDHAPYGVAMADASDSTQVEKEAGDRIREAEEAEEWEALADTLSDFLSGGYGDGENGGDGDVEMTGVVSTAAAGEEEEGDDDAEAPWWEVEDESIYEVAAGQASAVPCEDVEMEDAPDGDAEGEAALAGRAAGSTPPPGISAAMAGSAYSRLVNACFTTATAVIAAEARLLISERCSVDEVESLYASEETPLFPPPQDVHELRSCGGRALHFPASRKALEASLRAHRMRHNIKHVSVTKRDYLAPYSPLQRENCTKPMTKLATSAGRRGGDDDCSEIEEECYGSEARDLIEPTEFAVRLFLIAQATGTKYFLRYCPDDPTVTRFIKPTCVSTSYSAQSWTLQNVIGKCNSPESLEGFYTMFSRHRARITLVGTLWAIKTSFDAAAESTPAVSMLGMTIRARCTEVWARMNAHSAPARLQWHDDCRRAREAYDQVVSLEKPGDGEPLDTTVARAIGQDRYYPLAPPWAAPLLSVLPTKVCWWVDYLQRLASITYGTAPVLDISGGTCIPATPMAKAYPCEWIVTPLRKLRSGACATESGLDSRDVEDAIDRLVEAENEPASR